MTWCVNLGLFANLYLLHAIKKSLDPDSRVMVRECESVIIALSIRDLNNSRTMHGGLNRISTDLTFNNTRLAASLILDCSQSLLFSTYVYLYYTEFKLETE